ncbi:DUF2231 domain-containing protein [Vibrio sp. RC27]
MFEIIPNWHPIFVHFTVTLLTLSGVIQCIIWIKAPSDVSPLWFTRKWIHILGILAIFSTVLTGYHAYNTVTHDSVSHAAMSNHQHWALITSFVFVLGATLSLILKKKYLFPIGVVLVLSWGLVTVTAYKGGDLVYRYGLGVLSLPEANSSDHHHDMGDATDSHLHEKRMDEMALDEPNNAHKNKIEQQSIENKVESTEQHNHHHNDDHHH